MRNSKKLIVLLVILIAGVWLVVAQRNKWMEQDELPDGATELRRIVHQQQADSLMVEGDIRMYDGKEPGKMIEKLSFVSYRKGYTFYSKFGPLLMMANDQWMVQVDSNTQRIIVQQTDPLMLEQLKSASAGAQMLEKLWQDTAVFKVKLNVTAKGSERSLHIESEQHPEIQAASLTYDPVTARVKNAEIRWIKDEGIDKESGIWISRIRYASKPGYVFDIGAAIEKVVVVRNGRITPAPTYAAYELITGELETGNDVRGQNEINN